MRLGAHLCAGPLVWQFYVSGGKLVIAEESRIVSSRAVLSGGCLWMSGGNVELDGGSSISTSTTQWNGGAVWISSGSFTLSESSIIDSNSVLAGGAIFVTGGKVNLTSNSRVTDATASGEGGCFYLTSGEVHMTDAIIRNCRGDGAILATSPSALDSHPLLVATFTTFLQNQCDGSIFKSPGSAQLVLRAIFIEPLAGCDRDALASATAFAGVITKGCGEQYEASDQQISPVCSSRAAGACNSIPIAGTTLASLNCSCPAPSFVNPSLSAILAPYQTARGCIEPRVMERVEVVSGDVVVAAVKPDDIIVSVNASIIMQGDDWNHLARWAIVDPSSLSFDAPWLYLPRLSGNVSGAPRVEIAMHLSASNLRESAEPYQATLQVNVQSDLIETRRSLLVSLSVRARTHVARWGSCSGTAPNGSQAELLPLHGSAISGYTHSVPFTACDLDLLPVQHQLPTLLDPRRFNATLQPFGRAEPLVVPIGYLGEGVYAAHITVPTHGPYSVLLRLDDSVFPLQGNATCPEGAGRVPLPGGICGCRVGTFEDNAGACQECPAGTAKAAWNESPCLW